MEKIDIIACPLPDCNDSQTSIFWGHTCKYDFFKPLLGINLFCRSI